MTLGVYATSWTYYGNVGFADHYGLLFLATQIGKTLARDARPRAHALTRSRQLTSVADRFAFRDCSQSPLLGITLQRLA